MIWFLIIILSAVSALLILRPWWSKSSIEFVTRDNLNAAAYRQSVEELETELRAGLITSEVAAQRKAALTEALKSDAEQSATSDGLSADQKKSIWPVVAVVLFLPVIGLSGYYFDGSWKVQQKIEGKTEASASMDEGVDAEAHTEMAEMIADLKKRLEKTPDAEGFALLGRSQMGMQDFAAAAKSFARSNELSDNLNADWLVAEGEALGLSRERDLLGKPKKLFEQALARDPGHPKALWFGGMAAVQADDNETAQKYWTTLANLADTPDNIRPVLLERVAELKALSGENFGSVNSAENASNATTRILLEVSVDKALLANVPANAVLYVFAKAASGPPMPLAVQRIALPELPVAIELNETMAMAPGMSLDQFDNWIVTARISKAGGAIAENGDLQGSISLSKNQLDGKAKSLKITEVVKK